MLNIDRSDVLGIVVFVFFFWVIKKYYLLPHHTSTLRYSGERVYFNIYLFNLNHFVLFVSNCNNKTIFCLRWSNIVFVFTRRVLACLVVNNNNNRIRKKNESIIHGVMLCW